jgi:hypothetical protein
VTRKSVADVAAGYRVNQHVDRRLVDEAVAAYVDWRNESTTVWDTYGRWTRATVADAPLAFSAYRAAIDREEHASRVYASFMKRVATALSAERASPAGCELDNHAKRRRVQVVIPERGRRASAAAATASAGTSWRGAAE